MSGCWRVSGTSHLATGTRLRPCSSCETSESSNARRGYPLSFCAGTAVPPAQAFVLAGRVDRELPRPEREGRTEAERVCHADPRTRPAAGTERGGRDYRRPFPRSAAWDPLCLEGPGRGERVPDNLGRKAVRGTALRVQRDNC